MLAQIGRLADAEALVNNALARPDLRTEADLVLEAAEYEDSYGDPDRASTFLDEADSFPGLSLKHRWIRSLVGARFLIRRRRYDEASLLLSEDGAIDATSPGLGVARLVDTAHLAASIGDPRASAAASIARDAAQRQRAHRSRRIADLLVAYQSPDEELSIAITSIGARSPWHLTYLADLFVRRASNLDAQAIRSDSARDADASSALASRPQIRARFIDRVSRR